ncbi:MAG: hypothetical protein ACJA2G_000986, partial [Cognaticolwellia sp.]
MCGDARFELVTELSNTQTSTLSFKLRKVIKLSEVIKNKKWSVMQDSNFRLN